MKLKIQFILFTLLFISGSVFSAPLSGVYTIGGTSPNYATFSAALSALSASGISGPVTFNVRPGTYNETVTFSAVTGASATNRITFQSEDGVAADVTIRASSNGGGYYNPIFVLSAAQYYTFNNLTITYGSVSSGYVYIFLMQFVYGSLNDSINHCILNGINYGNGVADNWIIWDQNAGSGVGTNSNVVLNGCQFNGGAYAYADAYSTTPGGPSFINNTFTGQYFGALVFTSCNNVHIQGNTFNASTNTSYVGIEMDQCTNASIVGNKLLNGDGVGIWFDCASCSGYGSTGAVSSNFYMANNYIESQYGIRGAGVDSFSIYNNTLRTTLQGITLTSGSGNILLDNIFDNSGTSTSEIFNLNSASNFKESDYNDFYSAGLLARITGTYSNLAAWQTGTGFDAHSRSVIPPFVSGTDYHLTTCDSLNFGLALGITYDIDSDIRSTVSPVVGAYECPSLSLIAQFGANDTAVCVGSAVTFTDQSTGGPTSWRWTFTSGSPDTSSSQNPHVTYNAAGTFTVKLVVSNATNTDSIIKTGYIDVYAIPIVGIITANPDSICTGSSAQLTVTGSSGTIQWQSSGNGVSFTNISSANTAAYTTPALIQTTYYRVDISNLCGTDSSEAAKVFVTPVPVAGTISALPDTICTGSVVGLSDTGATGNSLQWQLSTGDSYSNINGANSFTYNTPTLTQSVDYRLVVSNSSCADTSAPVAVTVNPAPVPPTVATGDSIICSNDSARIQASGPYASYHWNDGDTTSYTWANAAGAYWVSVSDVNGCTAISGQQNIGVYPEGNILVVQGDTLSDYGGISYRWYLNDTIIPGATGSFYVARETGNYSVQMTDSNGCTSLTGGAYIMVTGIAGVDMSSSVSIYPDPVGNTLFIKWNDAAINITDIEVYNVLGEMMILSKKASGFYSSPLPVDVSAFPGGVYVVVARANNTGYMEKIVKE